MKRYSNNIFIFLIAFTLLASCNKGNENFQFDYPYLIMGKISNIDATGITASAEIKNLGLDSIIDFGFVWCKKDTPTIENFRISIDREPSIGTFSERINNSITPNTIYNIRPFIRGKKHLVYGDILQFTGAGSLNPKLNNFEPKEGKRNSLVTITGENFNSNPQVYFGTVKANVLKASSHEILVEVPGAIGNVKLLLNQNGINFEAPGTYNVFYPWTTITLPDEILATENPTGFGINDMVYIFGGHSVTTNKYSKNLWEFNPANNVWTLKAEFPGAARQYAVCFVINKKAYFGLGDNGTFSQGFSDLWEYDPLNDIWTRKADFPLINYIYPTGTSDNTSGSIGLGLEPNGQLSSKFWIFDPSSNSWQQIADFPFKAFLSTSFCTENITYAGLGLGTENYSSIYEFNSLTNSWTNKKTYPGKGRWHVKNFVIGDKVYIGLGNVNNGPVFCDFWELKASENSWKQMIDFPNPVVQARTIFTAFSTIYKGYILENRYESSTSKRYLWEFDPEKN
jgi:N-acetylneuraminic acid mutarotase